MKIIITGSLGNISKPLTINLVQSGHDVTVISSKKENQTNIEALGAAAAIGSIEDIDFLTATFTGADIVYCMVPPKYFEEPDVTSYYQRIGGKYAQAIEQSGVKRVFHLSSYGADKDKGTGLIFGSHLVEGIMNKLSGVNVTHVRPAYFYYNLLSFVNMIKTAGMMFSNYGRSKFILVSPNDIAAAIAEEMLSPNHDPKVRYVASDELSGSEIAAILGNVIGKPDLQWQMISNEQMHNGLLTNGFPTALADVFVEMFAAIDNGILSQDFYLNNNKVTGKTKLSAFAKEFASVYNQKQSDHATV